MTTVIRADDVQPGDRILICGRPEQVVRTETVTRVQPGGDYDIHVYVPDDPSDPYVYRCDEVVHLVQRPA